MEDIKNKSDNKPYLVFSCSKCQQFIYSKLTQKTKKCLRCGKIHTINSIKRKGEIINGITNTFEYVKKKQNEFAVEMSGLDPKFTALNDFNIAGEIKLINETAFKPNKNKDLDENLVNNFTLLLQKLSKMHKEFPLYSIELMADDFNIPISELKTLINSFKIRGILIPLQNNYHKVNL